MVFPFVTTLIGLPYFHVVKHDGAGLFDDMDDGGGNIFFGHHPGLAWGEIKSCFDKKVCADSGGVNACDFDATSG